MDEDYSMDLKIWNNGKDYYIEVDDFNENNKTLLPPGAELYVYSETNKKVVDTYFASLEHNWIKY